MTGYIPVRTKMDSEDHYHSPFENDPDGIHEGHYEAPSCLRRNPSGSIFISNGPTDPSPGDSTLPLEARLRYAGTYSPHHTGTMGERVVERGGRQGAYSPQPSSNTSSSSTNRQENLYSNAAGGSQYNVGTIGTRLGTTLLNRGGVGASGAVVVGGGSPARSPQNESYKNINRTTLPTYSSSSGQLTGVFHPSSHPSHNQTLATSLKRPTSSSQSGSSHSQSFRLKSDISSRCSWKFVAIFFILFSSLLVTALIYTAASNYIIGNGVGFETAKACAVIDDSRVSENEFDTLLDVVTNKNIVDPSSNVNILKVGSTGASLPPEGSTFKPLTMGEKQVQTIPPYSYWNFQFHQKQSSYISFSFSIPRGSSIGLYARKNAIPTLTNNDLRDVLKGFRSPQTQSLLQREIRSSVPTLMRESSYYLDMGHWFLSLYNDAGDPQTLEMTASVAHDMTSSCPRGCSGNGECVLGYCQCNPGYDGPDCSQSTCPVLCSNNGEYEEGSCRCYPGWKGAECSIHHNECEVPDCSNHGNCINGECFVHLVSQGTSAIKWTAKTPVVLVMDFVLLEPACVGKAGEVIAVELWTTRRGNVSPTAPDMGSLI